MNANSMGSNNENEMELAAPALLKATFVFWMNKKLQMA